MPTTLLEGLEAQRAASSPLVKNDHYLSLLHAQPGERVVDVGCGGGWLCRRVAPLLAPDGYVVGVDSSAVAIELASTHPPIVSPGVLRFECADATTLPFADGEFDAALCISMLAFCAEPDRALAEVRRVLRPGGRLVAASSDEDTRLFNARDRDLGRRLQRALGNRTRDPWAGRRLNHLVVQAGYRVIREMVVCEIERHFQPGLAGYTLAHGLRSYLITSGGVSVEDYEGWLAELRQTEWEGSYCYGVMTFACIAEREI